MYNNGMTKTKLHKHMLEKILGEGNRRFVSNWCNNNEKKTLIFILILLYISNKK